MAFLCFKAQPNLLLKNMSYTSPIEIQKMLNRLTKLLVPLGIIGLAVFIAIIMVNSRQTLQVTGAPALLPRVETLAVALGDVTPMIVAHGNVGARYQLELATEVTGRVVWVAPEFVPGKMVKTGQVLLRIDPLNYRLELAQAQATLETAKLALADAQALKRKALIVESKLKIEAAQQRVAKSEQDLDYTEIRSPFNAVIDEQSVEYGQFISTGRTVAKLLSTDTAEVSLQVPPSDAGFVDPAASASVQLSARIGAQQWRWQAKLLRIESRVDQRSRSIPVVVEVALPYDSSAHAHTLPLGLFVRADIPGKSISAAVRLPTGVLHADNSVFVVVGGALQRRHVNIAYRDGNTVVINAGLASGERVVATRLEVMFEGMKVESDNA
ncbi:MAG: RND family efflux transporter MFP subunit [Halioglobus sp.]